MTYNIWVDYMYKGEVVRVKKEKVLEIIGFLGSVSSLISYFFIDKEWPPLKIVLLIVGILGTLVLGYVLFIMQNDNYKKCKSKEEVNQFMKEWIKTDGVVEVLSRDLSWVDTEMQTIFAEKGEDLYLFVEKETEKTKRLIGRVPQSNIIYYSDYGFQPKSRFTFIHANKDNRQMAIAIKEEETPKRFNHEIYILNDSQFDKKMMVLAKDLLDLLKCIRNRENDKKV